MYIYMINGGGVDKGRTTSWDLGTDRSWLFKYDGLIRGNSWLPKEMEQGARDR